MLTYTARLLLDGVGPTVCLPALAPQAAETYSRAGAARRRHRAGRRAAPRALRVAARAGRARRRRRSCLGPALRVCSRRPGHAAQATRLRRGLRRLRLLRAVGL